MATASMACYPPLDTLKPVAADAWIVDGPIIRFGMPWPKMPFPTRMTLLRLGEGDLLVHSPTPLAGALRDQIAPRIRAARVGADRHEVRARLCAECEFDLASFSERAIAVSVAGAWSIDRLALAIRRARDGR